jgi:hypothetical protein
MKNSALTVLRNGYAQAWGAGELLGFTGRLIAATDAERDFFNRAFDQFTQGGRNNGNA